MPPPQIDQRRHMARTAAVAFALALSSGVLACGPEIIPPTGPFNVGVSKHAIDFVNPDDPLAPGNVTTSYLATVFYPTLEDGPIPPTPYLHPEGVRSLAEQLAVVTGVIDHEAIAALTSSHLRWGAEPAPADALLERVKHNHTTLIWSAGGRGGPAEMSTMLLSDLASRGYAVIGLDHPYEQPFVWYPNPSSPGGGGPRDPGVTPVAGAPASISLPDDLVRAIYATRVREMKHMAETGWPELVARQGWPFATANIGLLGLSLGGATALGTLHETSDALTRAGLNLDGAMWTPPGQDLGKNRPQLLFGSWFHVSADDPAPAPGSWVDQTWENYTASQTGWWRRTLTDGYGHWDALDAAYWKELVAHNLTENIVGAIPGARAVEITRRTVAAFFDKWIRGVEDEAGLLDNPGRVFKEMKSVAGQDGK
ncbi:hypothetical protein RB595_008094 [Gaeumannomyces hyphopodioides]